MSKTAYLVMILGPHVGFTYEVPQGGCHIGQDGADDSGQPAQIVIGDHGVAIRDINATGAIRVNDSKIDAADLRDGDLIMIEQSVYKFFWRDDVEGSSFERDIFTLTTIDVLTQVGNRRYFDDRLAATFSRAREDEQALSLFIIDIDRFRRCNASYGYAAGDFVLRQVARLATLFLRQVDMLGRYGGQTFAVLLPRVDIHGAQLVAEQIRQRIADEVYVFEGRDIRVAVSIGVAALDSSVVNHADLVATAERRLLAAKVDGDRVVARD